MAREREGPKAAHGEERMGPPEEEGIGGLAAGEAPRAVDRESPPVEEEEHTLRLREERLVARKHRERVGDITFRKEVEEIPGRVEAEAYREEVEVEREPVNEVVQERAEPWEEGDALVVPVYEERLVVSKQLVLRERLRIHRLRTTEKQLFEDQLRRERLEIEDTEHTGALRERQYSEAGEVGETPEEPSRREEKGESLGDSLRRLLG